MTRLKVALIYGGRSTEHEVSLLSAQNIFANMDPLKYECICIGIDKKGQWYYHGESVKVINPDDPKTIALETNAPRVIFNHNANDHCFYDQDNLLNRLVKVDAFFPIVHGTDGEDGALQGLCQLANMPIVGPGLMSSAICMDKEIMKRILTYSEIKNAEFVTVYKKDYQALDYKSVRDKLGSELFIKPVNLGSSVGVSHVKSEAEFMPALEHAFKFDTKVLIEKRMIGREVECAVLGNNNPESSVPGEVIPKDGFYSYDTKYIDEHGAQLVMPADLNESQVTKLKEVAVKTYQLMECSGLARVDMFLTPEDEIYINELNTLPGFTKISMYPKLWELSGLDMKSLISRLIELAMERQEKQDELLKSV